MTIGREDFGQELGVAIIIAKPEIVAEELLVMVLVGNLLPLL